MSVSTPDIDPIGPQVIQSSIFRVNLSHLNVLKALFISCLTWVKRPYLLKYDKQEQYGVITAHLPTVVYAAISVSERFRNIS